MHTLASTIISWARLQGIDHAFVLAGADVDVLVKAVRSDSRFKVVYATSETAAVNMAEGYSRRTGRPSLVIACGGPGLAGLVAGAAQAVASGCPILYLSGSTSANQDEVGWLVPDGPLMAAAGCASLAINAPAEAPGCLLRAGQLLAEGCQVHLQVTTPVQSLACPPMGGDSLSPSPKSRPVIPTGLFVFAVGGQALSQGDKIAALAVSKSVPLVTDMTARGLLPEDHPLVMGHLTFSPEPRAVAAVTADHPKVVALAPGPALLSALRQLKVAPEVVEQAQLEEWLASANRSVAVSHERAEWLARLNRDHPRINPRPTGSGDPDHGSVVALAQEVLGPSTVHVVDAGVFHQSAAARLRAHAPRTIISTDTLTAMGWSFGAAIGAALGSNDQPVVAYAGDGCFHLQGLALATAAQLRLGILFIVGINGVYASTRARHAIGPDDPAVLPPCDIPAVAQACGVPATTCANLSALRSALADFNPAQGPRLLAVSVGVSDDFIKGRPLGIVGLDKRP